MLSLPEELNKMNLSKIPGSKNNSIDYTFIRNNCLKGLLKRNLLITYFQVKKKNAKRS